MKKRPVSAEDKGADDISGMMKIDYVETDEIDVRQPYKTRIEKLIQNYEPNTKTDTRTETRITFL